MTPPAERHKMENGDEGDCIDCITQLTLHRVYGATFLAHDQLITHYQLSLHQEGCVHS